MTSDELTAVCAIIGPARVVRRHDRVHALLDAGDVTVTLRQKARGGITITATA